MKNDIGLTWCSISVICFLAVIGMIFTYFAYPLLVAIDGWVK